MKLVIRNKNLLKKYALEYNEKRYLSNKLVGELNKNTKIGIEYLGRNITFKVLNDIMGNDSSEYEKLLELAEKALNNIKFTTDSSGKINKVRNMDEILSKWNSIKSASLGDVLDRKLKNFAFEISKILSNESKLTSLVKEYNIIPYIFLGLYEKNYSDNLPVMISTEFRNLFSQMAIPVKLELYGKESNKNHLILSFVGRELQSFDRFSYMDDIVRVYPELKHYYADDFTMKMKGFYIYERENSLLSNFEINIEIKVKKEFIGEIKYILKEE